MKSNRTVLFLAFLSLLLIPTFFRMLRPGLYSMQDFPYFRVVEYAKCLHDFQIPCRWAPDAATGYGEPIFSFYSHVPFFLSAILTQIGFSYQIALKSIFAFSLIGSAISMFFLAKRVWKNEWAALVCALLYVYAPYRAVNVWVRGAFPEAFAFVLIPLIFLTFELFLEKKSRIHLSTFAICLALLVLTHNLSVILYAPLICSWIILRIIQTKSVKFLPHIFLSSLLAAGLSAFYILPTLFESKFVTIAETTRGYFNFRAHFVTLPQIFISRFWGYGGSTWGSEDGLSLSIGHVQWILAVCILGLVSFILIRRKKTNEASSISVYLVVAGFLYLLLTHNKSAFLWEAFDSVSSFIQFPWRFLGPALFSFSLGAGYIFTYFSKRAYLMAVIVIALFFLNVPYFKEDIWYSQPDEYFLTGERWETSQVASIGDYWSIYGPIPKGDETFLSIKELNKTSNTQRFSYSLPEVANISFPLMYFPGWTAYEVTNVLPVTYDAKGFVNVRPQNSSGEITFKFENTEVRSYANTITLLSLILILCVIKYDRYMTTIKKT